MAHKTTLGGTIYGTGGKIQSELGMHSNCNIQKKRDKDTSRPCGAPTKQFPLTPAVIGGEGAMGGGSVGEGSRALLIHLP